jgi:membrane protein DedA with SNARE-associated domain
LLEDLLLGHIVSNFISQFGYVAVFGLVGIESFGIPAPGETALIAAAIVAAKGKLSITLVLLAAAGGGIIGDNIGFWVGRELGFRLLCRYGRHVRVGPKRMKLMQYLFLRYGKRIVFVGRFVSVLRAWEAFLAGADWMPWGQFAITNAAAVIVWTLVWGLSAYGLGHAPTGVIAWISSGISVVVVGLLIYGWIYFRRHEEAFEAKVDKALPGPLRPRRHDAAELRSGET